MQSTKKMDLKFVEDHATMDNIGDVKIILVIIIVLDTGLKAIICYFLFVLSHATRDIHITQQLRNVLKPVPYLLFQLKKMELIFAKNLVMEMTIGSMNKRDV